MEMEFGADAVEKGDRFLMWSYEKRLQYPVSIKNPDAKAAKIIIRDKSHPRYMELYRRWQEHVRSTEKPMQFPNFVRAELAKEGG